jgi:isoleucyl-tRNA synthetase
MAEDGRKMSKHLGNILAPIPLMDSHGADALRWFMACSGSPWSQRRVGPGPLEEIARKLLMTYWNTASFFTLYASHAQWAPQTASPAGRRPILDRWVLAEVHALTRAVDERLESYDTAGAGRLLADFVDDLSNWYVRRSRQRFWNGDQDALATLYECLNVLTRLLAPFVPFITEEVWQKVIRSGDPDAPESVHLATWPQADLGLIDQTLSAQVRTARALAEAGRAARKNSKVRIRQPLGRGLVGLPTGAELPVALLEDVADELNVKQLAQLDAAGAVVDVTVKANFRVLGKRFGKQTQQVANALMAADPGEVVSQLRTRGEAQITLAGVEIALVADEVIVTEVPRSGWVVESQRGVTIALDTEISAELAAEGIARDVVRVIQQARRDAGLDVADRIALSVAGRADVLAAVRAHQDFVTRETLATSLALLDSLPAGFRGAVGAGVEITVHVVKA